jgi:DNA-binding LacI/PurR family transcriptional regulator
MIVEGSIPAGQFLPPERRLSEEHGVARKTVRRAIQTLEDEGLVTTVPRRGYRVLSAANDPDRGAPLAYVALSERLVEDLTPRYQAQMEALRAEAGRRGWSLLMITSASVSRAQLIEQAVTAKAGGMILDTEDPELIASALVTGIPAVMVDAWNPQFPVDCVMQDGHQGGLLAADYLASRGHERIAVIVPRVNDAHSTDRFGGAVAGLARAGLELPARYKVIAETKEELAPAVTELLRGSEPPTAFISLWTDLAYRADQAAQQADLKYGSDYEVVGWCVEEQYESRWAALFPGRPVPPAITWSIKTMAETAITRINERRANPSSPPLRVKIPTNLRLEAGG